MIPVCDGVKALIIPVCDEVKALTIPSCDRVTRLQETLVAVQQLEKNISSLQPWLAHIGTKLSDPIIYHTCNSQEIQRKLSQQQVVLICTHTQPRNIQQKHTHQAYTHKRILT